MTASAARPPELVPVHVGHPIPTPEQPKPIILGGGGAAGRPAGRILRIRQSPLTDVGIDWRRHGLEPRWVGMEGADCAAALQPNIERGRGATERQRFLAGTADRAETAIVVTMLGYAYDDEPRPFSAWEDSVSLGSRTMISGSRLGAGTRPTLAANVSGAARDLGLRLLNRPADAPWWTLKLSGTTSNAGPPHRYVPDGEFLPILVDLLGDPVVGVWVSPDYQQRWYVIPDAVDWNTVLDWLVQQALPVYAPTVLRRYRAAAFVDPDLQTLAEAAARKALVDMEARYVEERARLEAEFGRVQTEAEPVRYGLLYGTGATLVEAVNAVLTAAGFTTVDLDKELGGTWSADLRATLGEHVRLVEVKSSSGRAGESLIADLLKHLDTWPQFRPQQPVGGGALIVNSQHKLPPDQRTRQVYTRPEFIKALTVPVISTRELFDWWKESNWVAIQHAVLGATTPSTGGTTTTPTSTAAPITVPTRQAERRSLFRKRCQP